MKLNVASRRKIIANRGMGGSNGSPILRISTNCLFLFVGGGDLQIMIMDFLLLATLKYMGGPLLIKVGLVNPNRQIGGTSSRVPNVFPLLN